MFRRTFFLLQDEQDEAGIWLLLSPLGTIISLKGDYPGTTALQYRPASSYSSFYHMI